MRKRKIMKMSWKNSANSLTIHTKLELNIFFKISIPFQYFLPQIIVIENLNSDLEKSLKNGYEKVWEP